jgi:hypothetical protein
VICDIKDTGPYNGTIAGIVKRSSEVLGCRPNYFAETGYYVIILNLSWHGYPKSLGSVVFKGLKGPMTQKQYDAAVDIVNNVDSLSPGVEEAIAKTKEALFSTPGIIAMTFIGLVLVILIISSILKEKNRM